MGTFDELEDGTRFMSPSRTINDHAAKAFVGLGGYTHPLFTDQDYASRSPFGRSPLPGEAVLLVMGGLVEQTERFGEDTIALVGFERVRFRAPAFAGDTVRVDVRVRGKERRDDGKGVVHFDWVCENERGEVLVEAEARMLFRVEEGG